MISTEPKFYKIEQNLRRNKMGKHPFYKIKKTLAILFLVLFLTSIAPSAVNAARAGNKANTNITINNKGFVEILRNN
jgi:hypothetical protein